MAHDKEKEPDEKKEVFETPKVLNLEGGEITDEQLEGAAGGVPADLADGNSCSGGGNTCSTGTS